MDSLNTCGLCYSTIIIIYHSKGETFLNESSNLGAKELQKQRHSCFCNLEISYE